MLIARRLCLIASLLLPAAGVCGPPFATDDPAVVDTGGVELLAFHQSTLGAQGRAGVLAGLESHFGVAKNFELDLTAPLAFAHPTAGGTQHGYGDTTLGFKCRLLDETPAHPLVALVPKVNFATGNARRGLGNGGTQVFLGASVQKAFAAYQTYATAGYWLNRGGGNRNYVFAGWVVQREVTSRWTLGVELFANGATTTEQPPSLGFNAGGYYKLDEHDQILFSAGRGLVHAADTNRASTYLGYLRSF